MLHVFSRDLSSVHHAYTVACLHVRKLPGDLADKLF